MYISYEFYRLSALEKKRYWTNRDQHKFENNINDLSATDIFNHKQVTNKVFQKFIPRDWSFGTYTSEEEVKNFLRLHDKVIVKPFGASSGKGVFSISKSKLENFDTMVQNLQQFSTSP